MDTHRVLRRRTDALTGLAVASYLIWFAVEAATLWHHVTTSPDRDVALAAAAGLAVIWVILVTQVIVVVTHQVRGRTALFAGGGVVWLASLVVVVITAWGPQTVTNADRRAPPPTVFSVAPPTAGPARHTSTPPAPAFRWTDENTPHVAPHRDTPTHVPASAESPSPTAVSRDAAPALSIGAAGGLPLALVAKRRRDFLTQARLEPNDDDVDDLIDDLRGFDEREVAVLRAAIGESPSGWVRIRHDAPRDTDADLTTPTVAVLVAADDVASIVAYAQPGHDLPLGPAAATLVDRTAAVISGPGRCHVAASPAETLRALALRNDLADVVIYLGPSVDLDDELARRCVTIGDAAPVDGDETSEHAWRFSDLASVSPRAPDPAPAPARGAVRVLLLRAEPAVTGLAEPFTATLRRRCVEMTAYLTVHVSEPVTGERLRARVLGRGDDASTRTLANTATAVRRSLGADATGLRLHPVTPAGLYHLHGVSCDLLDFHRLVASAQDPRCADGPSALRRALELIDGEPLATALRGFEWFLAEGHLARLQRAGEWAALALAAAARDDGDLDLAFWAIEQGRLVDPYSEALEAALHRVPRRRDFRGARAPGATDSTASSRL